MNTKEEYSKQDVHDLVNVQLEQKFEAMGNVGPVKGENHLAKMAVELKKLRDI